MNIRNCTLYKLRVLYLGIKPRFYAVSCAASLIYKISFRPHVLTPFSPEGIGWNLGLMICIWNCRCNLILVEIFEVLTAVIVKNTTFWDATLSSLTEVYWRFGGTYCNHLQGQNKVRSVASSIPGVSHSIFPYMLTMYNLPGPDPEEGSIRFP